MVDFEKNVPFLVWAWADPEKFREGVLRTNFSHFTEGRTKLPREAIGPFESNCFSRGSVPDFLKKPIVTCDFLGGPDPLLPPS